MSKDRKKVQEKISADTDRLYGSLTEAIKYLHEIRGKYPNASLQENWTGYEDMELVFAFTRDETDDEYEYRLEREKQAQEAERAIKKRVQEEAMKNRLLAEIKAMSASEVAAKFK